MVTKEKTKNYYSAHNFATRVIFSTKASLHDGEHDGVDGPMRAFEQWQTIGRQRVQNSTPGRVSTKLLYI